MINLQVTKRTDERLKQLMNVHYSKPKGFVGRNICYAIIHDHNYYGHIIGGSCTLNLPGRDKEAKLFIHKTCKPLSEVEFNTEEDQLDMFDNACEGMCGV